MQHWHRIKIEGCEVTFQGFRPNYVKRQYHATEASLFRLIRVINAHVSELWFDDIQQATFNVTI